MRTLRVRGWEMSAAVVAIVGLAGWAYSAAATEEAGAKQANQTAKTAKADGAEIFNREWLPKDARAGRGDGLGPVFNDTSCVACHNQGGVGGGGPASKNVDVISVFSNVADSDPFGPAPATLPEAMFRAMFGGFGGSAVQVTDATVQSVKAGAMDPKELAKKQKKELETIHPGFVNARSVVLHKSSTDPAYDAWRLQMKGQGQMVFHAVEVDGGAVLQGDLILDAAPATTFTVTEAVEVAVQAAEVEVTTPPLQESAAQAARNQLAQQLIQQHRNDVQLFRSSPQAHIGNFVFLSSQRNPTALYGAGLIDSIPVEAIKENAQKKHKDFPEVQGRIAKLKDGRIGRFGWKNQTATLYDFAMTACAVELGLDVPDHPQAGLPHNKDYKSSGHDMSKEECNALVDYLKRLPAPERAKPAGKQEAEYLAAGEATFKAVGCATCHTQELGNAKGVYSDLLLHDMGQDLGDTGSYGTFIPNSPEEGSDEPIPSLAQQHGIFGGIGSGGVAKVDRQNTIGALRQEWRTPPLWGVRDSGPYLHDGRADTLEQAIALHGGEAARSAQRFFEIKPEERMQVLAFLKSLRAPETLVAAR
ncbi:MAG: di-heme oxidoredictase family protein [Pirellulales bacterium]